MGIQVVNNVTEANSIRRSRMTEYTASTNKNTNTAPSIQGMSVPISKVDAVGYNNITQSQAQMLAQELGKGTDYSKVTSSIMFGVQWDAVCVFIEKYDTNNTAETKSEWLNRKYGNLWGNYKDSTYVLNRGLYSPSSGSAYLNKTTTQKGDSDKWLYTTGAVEKNSSLNIYDFGGNFGEWTLCSSNSAYDPCMFGGSYFEFLGGATSSDCLGTWKSESYTSSRISLCM